MLANGIKVGYKDSGTTYTWIPEIMEVPELGSEPEKVDGTTLSDKNKIYEMGIGDLPEMEYKCKYVPKGSFDELEKLQKSQKVLHFVQVFPDGLAYGFDAQVAVKLGGGASNGLIQFTMKLFVQSEIERETVTEVKPK